VTAILLLSSTLFMVQCEQIDNLSYVEFLHFKILYKNEVCIKLQVQNINK